MAFGTVNPLQKPRFLELRSLGPGPFSNQKSVDPILQTAIFGQDLNFPILTCQMTSQPMNLKNAQNFPLLFIGTSGMYPIPLGCGVYAIRRGLGSPGDQKSLQFKVRAPPDQNKTAKRHPNPINMTQLESASKTQTTQYRAPRPRLHLHLPKNNSHKLTRCNGDVNVTVINSKTKINGCNGSREDGREEPLARNPQQANIADTDRSSNDFRSLSTH